MKLKLMCLMMAMASSLVMAKKYDLVVANYRDANTGYLYRLDKDIYYQGPAPGNMTNFVIWQTANRSLDRIAFESLNGNLYVGLDGNDKYINQYNVSTGALVGRMTATGIQSNNLTYGYDWNSDGVPDLWVISPTVLYVYSGVTTTGSTAATLLASWTVADSLTTVYDGTGGTAILYGPDITGDGVPELYVGKGGNNAYGRINVYNLAASTAGSLVRTASYSAGNTRDIGSMILGPDVNADGLLDLLVVSSRNYQFRAFNYKTGADLGVVDDGLSGRYYPLGMALQPDGSLIVGSRMKSELDPGWVTGAETAGGNLIRFDRAAGTAVAYMPTLLATSPLGGVLDFRFTSAAVIAPKAYASVPVDGKKVPLETSQINWTLPDPNAVGGTVTCDVWFSETYPKYLPHLEPNVSSLADPNLWYVENQSFTSYATKVINNQVVTSLNLSTVTTLPLTYGKTYYWRVDTRDSSDTALGTVIGKVWKFTAYNSAPVVDAGDTVYTWLTGGTVNVTMAPTIWDDGRPNPPGVVTVLWEESPDSANLVINNPALATTTATITATGTYTLKLTVNDSELSTFDTVVLNVYADACTAAKGVPGYVRPTADFDNDCDVDLTDFNTVASQWLESTVLAAPLP
jgi:hypothetical protein